MISLSSLNQHLSQVPIPGLATSLLLRLPLEIILMILEILPPSSLIPFFCSSKQALSYAEPFCQQHPLQFYRYLDAKCPMRSQWPTLMLTLYSIFSPSQYSGLDQRWEVISKVVHRTKCMSFVPLGYSLFRTINPTSLFQSVNHPFGYEELVAEIPVNLKIIGLYHVWLDTGYYVCGMEFKSSQETAYFLLGRRSKFHHKLCVSLIGSDIIRFITDPWGIKSIMLGDSQWSCGNPQSLGCWEGFTKRQADSRIRVVQDVRTLIHTARPC